MTFFLRTSLYFPSQVEKLLPNQSMEEWGRRSDAEGEKRASSKTDKKEVAQCLVEIGRETNTAIVIVIKFADQIVENSGALPNMRKKFDID